MSITNFITDIVMSGGKDIVTSTITGSQFGSTSSQKIGFWGATAITRPAATTEIKTAFINMGLLNSGIADFNIVQGRGFAKDWNALQDINAGRNIKADQNFQWKNTQGLNKTISARKADDSGGCTIDVNGGIITNTTC